MLHPPDANTVPLRLPARLDVTKKIRLCRKRYLQYIRILTWTEKAITNRSREEYTIFAKFFHSSSILASCVFRHENELFPEVAFFVATQLTPGRGVILERPYGLAASHRANKTPTILDLSSHRRLSGESIAVEAETHLLSTPIFN